MKSHVRHFGGGGFPMVALPQYDIRKVPLFCILVTTACFSHHATGHQCLGSGPEDPEH